MSEKRGVGLKGADLLALLLLVLPENAGQRGNRGGFDGFGSFGGYGGSGHDGDPPLNSTSLFRHPDFWGAVGQDQAWIQKMLAIVLRKCSYPWNSQKSPKAKVSPKVTQELRVRPPGVEWKTPKMGKNGRLNRNGPRPEIGENGPKVVKIENDPKSHFSAIFPHVGLWAIFYLSATFSHFRLSARFRSIPGYLTRPL